MDQEKNQQLYTALGNTYSPHDQDRKNAEIILTQFQTVPGFTKSLFHLVSTNDIAIEIRQAGTILLKNLIHKKWDGIEPGTPEVFPEDTKNFIKNNLIFHMATVPKKIESQLGQALYDIIKTDYPDKWNNLIPDILQVLASQDPLRIRGVLYVLRIIAKRFEYVSSMLDKRAQLYKIVDLTFPVLIRLFQFLVQQNTLVSISMELLILKIFWSSSQFGAPPYFLLNNNFHPWIQIFTHILTRPVPTESEPQEKEEKAKWPPWSVKTWVSRIFERLIQRFAKPRVYDNDPNKEFCTLFMNQYILHILETDLKVLTSPLAPRMPSKVTTNCLNYLNNCIYYGKTWLVVKPHLHELVRGIFIPILLFDEENARAFEEDPQEYLRVELDVSTGFSDPRSAIIMFMADTVKFRGEEYLSLYMGHIVMILNRYAQSPPQQQNPKEKHAALLVISELSRILMDSESFKNSLEEMITYHVLPELESPHGFLRACAIWTFGQYHNIKYQNSENFLKGIQIVINSLHDKDLPVRVFSALTMPLFMKSKTVHPLIENIVPQLLEAYLSLMNQVDNDDLVGALETIINKFSDKIQQFIPEITTKLLEHYGRLVARGAELFDDEDQSRFLTATECLRAIITILDNTKTIPGMYAKLEPMLLPVLLQIGPELVDFFSEYIQILSFLTYYSEITNGMWMVFEKYTEIFFTWGGDYLQELLVPFDNFISRSTMKFLSGPYVEQVWQIYKKSLIDLDGGETNAAVACKLMEVVLVYCRGRVDPLVPMVVDLAQDRLHKAQMDHLKVSLLEMLANSLYYNPVLTLAFMESKNQTTAVFTTWFQLLNTAFKRRHEIKLTILGLSAILHLPFTQWPPTLQPELKTIIIAIIELCKKFRKIQAEKSEKSDETNSSEGTTSEDDSSSGGEEDEDVDEVKVDDTLPLTSDEFMSLKKNIKDLKKKIYADDEDVAPDMLSGVIMNKLAELYEDADTDESIEEEGEFLSLVDDVDEVLFFLEAFRVFSNKDTPVYQKLLQSFTEEEQLKLQELGEEGNSRQANKST